MDEEDLKERKEFRDMLTGLHLAVVGDEEKGIEGLVQKHDKTDKKIELIEEKLKKDHELLWWNRTAEGVWSIIKRPILYLITFAILAAIAGGSAWEYIRLKLGLVK